MITCDPVQWAVETYAQAQLGDPRRLSRLIGMMAAMATVPGVSFPEALQGNANQVNRGYRLLGNSHIDPRELLEPVLQQTHRRMLDADADAMFVAIGDTTDACFNHPSLRAQLGTIDGNEYDRGLLVQTTMLVSLDTSSPAGLLEQQVWTRPPEQFGKKHERKQRRYEDKESFKWERQDELIAERLGDTLMRRTITVVDREADVMEYLQYKLERAHPFVVRSCYNRCLVDAELKLREHLRVQPVRGHVEVEITQRGGRVGRRVELEMRSATVQLNPGWRRKGHRQLRVQRVGVVLLTEREPREGDDSPLCWVLFTDQPITTTAALERVMKLYALRWLCEEYHRCWKYDVDLESWRVQSLETLLRVVSLTASLAMRALQLQKYQGDEESSCLELLSDVEWRLLWTRFEKKPLPSEPPSAGWAYRRVARLGGWHDTKRTGRASARALKRGIETLATLVEGYRMMLEIHGLGGDQPPDETSD